MAFQLNYTDPKTGVNYPTSYWKVGPISTDLVKNSGACSFKGWASAEAFAAGNSPIADLNKSYMFNNQNVTAFNAASPTVNFSNVESLLESFAQIQDSFFSSATIVS